MEHFKSRNNDYFHFTNPRDDVSELDVDVNDESQYYDVDDDRSCDFNFHTYRPLGIDRSTPANSQMSGAVSQNDTVEPRAFDNEALIFQLDSTMKNISDKLQHTIEGIGTRISHLENETCKLDNYVEDVKNSEERYHGITHRKLRQMQSLLQEVQDGVLLLRDKHEIAAAQLQHSSATHQLAILHHSKRDKINVAPRSSCNTPFVKQQSNERTLSQPVSYHPVVMQAHEITPQQYVFPPYQQSHTPPQNKPDLQFPHFVQSQLSNTLVTHISNPRNYKSEFHAKHVPECASFSNITLHGELSSPYETSNVEPFESILRTQEESSRRNYIHTPVAQTLPHALPTAIDVTEESRFDENGNSITVDDTVDKVSGMGFRRDLVRACVRKLTVNGSRVDLNSVLDTMMKNK